MVSLLLSLKEDEGGGVAAGERKEGRKEWRSVNERPRETGRDKAEELDVNLNYLWERSRRFGLTAT